MFKRGFTGISLFLIILSALLTFLPNESLAAAKGALFINEKMANEAAAFYIERIGREDYKDWAGSSPAEPQLFTDLQGKPSVYLFSVVKNGEYKGYLTISARTDYYPLWEYTRAPRPTDNLDNSMDHLIIYQGVLKPVVKDFIFLGNWEYLVRFEDPKGKLFYSSLNSTHIIMDRVVEGRSNNYFARNIPNDATQTIDLAWKVVKGEVQDKTKNAPQGNSNYCTGINPANPVGSFNWYKGCGPTSITMILSYYGNISSPPSMGGKRIPELAEQPTTNNIGCFGNAPGYTAYNLHNNVVEAHRSIYDDTDILPQATCNNGSGTYTCLPLDFFSSTNCEVCCWGIGLYWNNGWREDAVDIINYVTAAPDLPYLPGIYDVPFNLDNREGGAFEFIDSSQNLWYYARKFQNEIDESDPVYFGLQDTNPKSGEQHYTQHAIVGVGYRYSSNYNARVYDTWSNQTERNWSLENLIFDVFNRFVYMEPPVTGNHPPELTFGPGTLNGLEYPTSGPGPSQNFTFTLQYYDKDEYSPALLAPNFGELFDETSVCKRQAYQTGNCVQGCRPYTGSEIAIVTGNGIFDGELYTLDGSGNWDTNNDLNGDLRWNSQDYDDVDGNGRRDGDNGPVFGRGKVFVDDSPYPMTWLGDGAPSNGTYQGTIELFEGTHYYYFIFEDGNGGVTRLPTSGAFTGPRVATSHDPDLTNGIVAPTTGSPSTIFTYSVLFSDQDGDTPSLAEVEYDTTKKLTMYESPLNAVGTLYKASYMFPKDQAVGTHTFRFHFQDRYGGDTYLPATGWFSGPVINGGDDPDLTAGGVFPESGKPANQYVFSIHYYSKSDKDSAKSPLKTLLYLDNKPFVMKLRDWTVPGGTAPDPANGTYEYVFNGLSVGSHEFYFLFSNAKGITRRYPTTNTIPFPTVSEGNSAPWLSGGSVTPTSGDQLTTFIYKVTYDDDDGDPPAPNKQFVYIDGEGHLMSVSAVESAAKADYTFSIGGLGTGSHSYYFMFEDSYGNKTRLPYINSYEGPNVTDTQKENTPPELLVGQVIPDTGNTATPFVYSVQYTDRDGDEPFTKFVYIDDQPKDMTLDAGLASDGVYTFTMKNLEGGNHSFYFSFTDGRGGSDRLPTIGEYNGPTVITEPTAYIPYWFVNNSSGVNTFIYLTNLGTFPVDAEIAFKDIGGMDKILKRVLIDPGQLLKIDVASLNVQGQGFGTISWKTGIINAFGIIYDFNNNNSYPLYFGSPTINGEAFIPFWQVSMQNQIDTNLMITNIDPVNTDVTINLKNNANTLLNSFDDVFDGNAMRILSVADMIAPSTAGNPFEAYGSLSLDWNVGRVNVWGVTLNYQAARGYPILYTKEMNTSPTYVPFWQVTNKINSNYDTFLMINNLGSKSLIPKINIYDHIGNILGVAAPIVKAGGVGVVPLSDYVTKSTEYGSATVTWTGNSPVKIWGTVFNLAEGAGHILQMNNNVNSVSPLHIPYFQHDPSRETILLISNMGDQTAQVVSEFYDKEGNSSGFYSMVIPPHATQILQAGQATQYSEGRAKITWGTGNVAVWGTIYDVLSNNFTEITFDTPKGTE